MSHWFLESLDSKMEKSPNYITTMMVQRVFCNVLFDVLFYLHVGLIFLSLLDLVKNNL